MELYPFACIPKKRASWSFTLSNVHNRPAALSVSRQCPGPFSTWSTNGKGLCIPFMASLSARQAPATIDF